jgi:TonB family protein
VERVVRSHVADVQSCYEQSMAEKGQTRKNAPGGRVVVAFTITPLGTVQNERVRSSTLKDPQVTGCILAAVRSWDFPKPEKAQPVEFPFDLKPVSGPKEKK